MKVTIKKKKNCKLLIFPKPRRFKTNTKLDKFNKTY